MATFRWGDEIGEGAFGLVREAEFAEADDSRDTGQALAVKLLREDLVGNEDAVRRFSREVRILSGLDHPHIIKVVGRNLSKSPPWFVMPRAESNLARELDEERGREWIVNTFRQVLDAMAYAHQQDVVHRDLKPGNVLFVGGVVMVSDFGLGKQLDASTLELTQSAEAMGTLRYMAPEQYGGVKHAKPPCDVYALGKILWEMLSGERPQPLQAPNLDRIPGDFRAFVARCCEQEPDDRYPNAAEALAAFDVLTAQDRPSAPPIEAAEEIVVRWLDTARGPDREVLRELDEHLHRYSDEEEMYFDLVPRLPDDLVEQYIHEFPNEFASMLEYYNAHIAGGLPFSYCDVVANFYFSVFFKVENPRTRRMILSRLIDMGASHNRYHVRRVVERLLAGIGDDRATAQLAGEVIRADPVHARWFTYERQGLTLPELVEAAFAEVQDSTTEEPEGVTTF